MMNYVTDVTTVTHSGYPKYTGDFLFLYGIRIFKMSYIGYMGYALLSGRRDPR